MTSPAILPMRHGDMPTERGWYVVAGAHPYIVEADPEMGLVWYSGVSGTDPIDRFTYLARIFPDRIGEEG